MRGFAAIGLDNPKFMSNVGGVMRAAGVYGAGCLIISGERHIKVAKLRGIPTDTQKTWRHMPVMQTNDLFDSHPVGSIPIAVDLIEGATPLPEYKHPENAFYIFGAEDATLGRRIIDRCRDKIYIPTKSCMNLAATVNVVLYDRCAKLNCWAGQNSS